MRRHADAVSRPPCIGVLFIPFTTVSVLASAAPLISDNLAACLMAYALTRTRLALPYTRADRRVSTAQLAGGEVGPA